MIGGLVTTARFGWAAVHGVDAFADALAQYTVRMVLRSRAVDSSAADEIVRRAQANVPQDTGRLYGGIKATGEDGLFTVTASATHGRGRWYDLDYAFLVETGTQGGIRGGRRGTTVNVETGRSSRAGAFNPVTGRRFRVADASRMSERTHPGTAAQPFFYPAVDGVMEERELHQAETLEGDL
ncbi:MULTISPECIES: hypothetical protein [Methylobacterium]|uniref:Uncharacterized protein n=1 Tax=Methylobacterium jeotgali TaxID=381630 RepID=A0ABQ4SZ97_9HYPH|nr:MULTISPECIES: hypothetical protein [Methylobacterium]PIU08204.1 MAG: hypothetical protein COT56_02470 [Methylobacterium sp. CG09_land_8_20_14_0_10_71_15]PIU15714.1 MAG: hypothetical protein COT28_03720 [Methylobacterium sp. CG08_land_8_20_14_0_20_71_15]GBU17221.1 hypothetical protein AwMethylo_14360 [Methylobacterium sp.]GJE07864.1 hypothetical protein AOPFMNJM_3196 [Methylobacterium jeotgali]